MSLDIQAIKSQESELLKVEVAEELEGGVPPEHDDHRRENAVGPRQSQLRHVTKIF